MFPIAAPPAAAVDGVLEISQSCAESTGCFSGNLYADNLLSGNTVDVAKPAGGTDGGGNLSFQVSRRGPRTLVEAAPIRPGR